MATENDLLSRIEGLEIRFQEITSLITAPDIIADQKRFMKLSKEYRDLERILDKGKEYRNLLGNIQEGRDTLEAESDPELRAMAREMMQEAEQRIPSLEEEIKLLLIPADPEDAKTSLWRSAAVRAVTKRLSSQVTSIRCMYATAKAVAGLLRSRA